MSSSTEQQVAMAMGITCLVITAISALLAVFAFISGIVDTSIIAMITGFALVGVAAGAGWGTVQFIDRVNPDRVRTRNIESVLNWRQRRDLRRARGSVVMEKALIEVENERDNITHQELEASQDPNKPPHKTQWTDPGTDVPRLNPREEFGH